MNIPSAAVTSTFYGDAPGITYVAGIRSNIFPETDVTPSITLDMGLGWTRVNFNRVDQHAAGSRAADLRLDVYEYHIGFSAGRRFGKTEPYAGVEIIRRQVKFKDLSTGSRAGGKLDEPSAFIGMKIPVFERESLIAEAAFSGGIRIGIGLSVRLK